MSDLCVLQMGTLRPLGEGLQEAPLVVRLGPGRRSFRRRGGPGEAPTGLFLGSMEEKKARWGPSHHYSLPFSRGGPRQLLSNTQSKPLSCSRRCCGSLLPRESHPGIPPLPSSSAFLPCPRDITASHPHTHTHPILSANRPLRGHLSPKATSPSASASMLCPGITLIVAHAPTHTHCPSWVTS